MDEQRFSGRVVLVTGAAGGLGAELCRSFAGAGADVLPVDTVGDDCLHADVGTTEGTSAMVDAAIERHGRLDVLVLNAGTQHVASIAEFPPAEWDRLHDVMVKGPYLAMQAAWPHLRVHRGSVVVVSSTSAFAADPDKSAYVSAKAGVLGLVRAAALEGAGHGIRVNAVAPGWMRTPMAEAQLAIAVRDEGLTEREARERMLSRQPVKRFVETTEVAAAALFLASDAASGITGTCLPVDLGLLAA